MDPPSTCCGCLWMPAHRHKSLGDGPAGGGKHHGQAREAEAEDEDMQVVELPPIRKKAPAQQSSSPSSSPQRRPPASTTPIKQASSPSSPPPLPAPHDVDLIGLRELQQQSPRVSPAPAPAPASSSSSSSSPPSSFKRRLKDEQGAAAALSPVPSGLEGDEAAAGRPSSSLGAGARLSVGPSFASPVATSSSSPSAVKPAPVNWAEAWAPVVREQQQAESQERAKAEFLAALGKGIVALKHDRKGHSRLRELYTPDGGLSFSWRHPTGGNSGGGEQHGHGGGGGGGVWERGRAVYPFHEILEVRRGTVPDPSTGGKEPGTETLRAACAKADLYKSFSLILKDRSVDFTCHSLEQMTYLVKGIATIVAEQRRAQVKARALAAAATASPSSASAAAAAAKGGTAAF